MYAAWLKTGPSDPERFGRMTPRQYLLEMIAHHDLTRSAREGSIYQAWLTAALSGAPVPEYRTLIEPQAPKKPVEIREVIGVLSEGRTKRTWDEWLHRYKT